MSLIAPERLTSESNDYKKFLLHNPSYVRTKVLPQSGSQTVTMMPTGTQESFFELTARPFNLYRSYLQFAMTVPNVNLLYNRVWVNTMSQIQSIQLLTRQNQYIIDISNLQNYLATVWPKELKPTDVSMDGAVDIPYNKFVPTRWDGSTGVLGPELDEIQSGAVGTAVGSTQGIYTRYVCFPLRLILNSLAAVDHDLYLGGDVCLLHIIWGNGTKVAFNNDNAAVGAGAFTAITGNIAISGLQLQLAMQTNIHLQNELISKVQSGSFSMYVPYVYSYKQNLAGATQSITQRFTRGHGHVLKKVLHAPFNGTGNAESLNTAYDHNNKTANFDGSAVVAPKVISYYTMLDQNREQAYDVQCQGVVNPNANSIPIVLEGANEDDWILHKEQLQNSFLGSLEKYRFHWFHCSDYSGMPAKNEKPLPVPEGNVESGLSLERDRIWTIQLNMTNANYNHYTWAMTQKLMTIGGGDRGPVLVQ